MIANADRPPQERAFRYRPLADIGVGFTVVP